jgi:predicted RNase H-like HicB family nuclease
MTGRFILTDYVESAMATALYERFEDGSYGGRIPACTGVVAFGATRDGCERELRSVLEDWLLVGLKLGHTLPPVGGIDLSRAPAYEPVDAL